MKSAHAISHILTEVRDTIIVALFSSGRFGTLWGEMFRIDGNVDK
jgi:hypothetical protein